MNHRRSPIVRVHRKLTSRAGRLLAALFVCNSVMGGGCLDSEIAKRFRTAYVPGLVEGLSTAVSTPGDAETGLRRAWAALFEGLGAALTVRS